VPVLWGAAWAAIARFGVLDAERADAMGAAAA
jgi:hypothetical protein